MLRRSDGSELFMTVHKIDDSSEKVWTMSAIISYVEVTRKAEAVELIWNGQTMQAVLLCILPYTADDFMATISFHPDHPVLPT